MASYIKLGLFPQRKCTEVTKNLLIGRVFVQHSGLYLINTFADQ